MGDLFRARPINKDVASISRIGLSRIGGSGTRSRLRLSSPKGQRARIRIKSSGSSDLSPEIVERWEESRAKLVEIGLSDEDADRAIGKSSGHLKSPYWGESKERVVPVAEEVVGKLEFLRGLGMSDAEVSSIVKKFPEVLGCRLEEEIRNNVGVLDSTWGISGSALKNLLLRKPQVLGFNVDCKGDCMAECTRCWARF